MIGRLVLRLHRALLLGVLAAAGWACAAAPLAGQEPDAPYVPTPTAVVDTMLAVADPTPRDTVYDLGSGDGRLVIRAAERYGAAGVGVEIQAHLNERARRRAEKAGVADRVRFVTGDLFEVSLRPATVLILYLGRRINRQLRPRILEEMRPGSRVVSHAFDMGAWKADSLVQMPRELALVFSWVVPADVGGRWRVTLPGGAEMTLQLDQRFQELRLVAVDAPDGVTVDEPRLRGRRIWFRLARPGDDGKGRRVNMTGLVDGGRIEGALGSGGRWRAVRLEDTDPSMEEWSGELTRTSGSG